MRKISNPYAKLEGYNCFACSPGNLHGLQMKFVEDGDEVVSEWMPKEPFQGYFRVLHGGIQATLMDELASWLVQVKLKTAGVTSTMETRYMKPVSVDRGPVTLRARIEEPGRRLVKVKVELYDTEDVLCSEGHISYFLFSPEVARERLHYPGYENFFTGED